MTRMWIGTVALGMIAAGCGGSGSVESEDEQVSYAIGMDIGRSLAQVGDDVELELVFQGIRDVVNEGELVLTEDEARAVLQRFAARMQEQQQNDRAEMAQRNLEEGQVFLESNKDKTGITTTASGLQYEIIEAGSGAKPQPGQRVRVHYRGTFTDGTQFESSYDSGNPVEFGVSDVIPGWTEGLQLMSVGSKYRLFIPSDLAYGPMGSRGMEPNKTLIFEVELLEIMP